ncbi:nucleoside hydrolase [Georgenia sp. Z1344]|uniref:nucleoside hydrolase n=1 Tax=Georgenia sp. Z1344 TaxID=3416706 RepID=UPI003CF38080
MTRKIILDTDPGVGIPGTDADDPIALLLALADPRLDLLAVTTTFGNCPPELGARGAAAVLAAAGRPDIPVGVGRGTPIARDLPGVLRDAYDGERGREGAIALPQIDAGAAPTAVELIIETVRRHPGEVTIVAVGPQTNLAEALAQAPDIADAIESIVFMGGALGREPVYGRGNITPVAECNIWFDPEAADQVFRAGVPLTMVSLDVTSPASGVVLAADTIRSWEPTSTATRLLAEICSTYLDRPMFEWADGCVLYDPLAVAVAADGALGRFEDLLVGVETNGDLTTGQTVELRDGDPNLRALVEVDGPRVVDHMVDTLFTHL